MGTSTSSPIASCCEKVHEARGRGGEAPADTSGTKQQENRRGSSQLPGSASCRDDLWAIPEKSRVPQLRKGFTTENFPGLANREHKLAVAESSSCKAWMLHGIADCADEAGQKRESEGQSNPHPPAASSRTGSSDDGRLLEHIFARLDVSGSGQVETASIQRKIEVILNQEMTEDEIRIRLGWNAPRTHIREWEFKALMGQLAGASLPPSSAPRAYESEGGSRAGRGGGAGEGPSGGAWHPAARGPGSPAPSLPRAAGSSVGGGSSTRSDTPESALVVSWHGRSPDAKGRVVPARNRAALLHRPSHRLLSF